MSETINQPPSNLLDDVEQAIPFDVDAEIDEASSRTKQQYDNVALDAEELIDSDPDPGAPEGQGEGTTMGVMARHKAADALMLMIDRAQAGLFTLFGAKGHAEDFRFNKVDRKEMAGYLVQGLPEDFKMPWWIPFLIMLITQLAMNYSRLKEIKEERRLALEAEQAKRRKEQLEEQEALQGDVLRDRRQERTERRAQGDTAQQAAAATGDGSLCPECNSNELAPGRKYCSASCRSKANGRKRSVKK